MRTFAISVIAASGILFAPLRADFSYEQTTRITGGSLVRMMRMVPGGGKALEPQTQSVLIQGNRMATVSARDIQVIDLDKETMTHIDLNKKTYAVITFAEFRDAMQAMQQKMQKQTKQETSMDFKFEVKDTGKTQAIRGLNTKEMLLIISAEMKDTKSGQSGTMEIQSDMWMAKSVPGYQEVRDFQVRYAQKLAYSLDALRYGRMTMQPGMGEGMARMAKEASKLEGVPVLQTMIMKGVGGPGGMPEPDATSSSSSSSSDSDSSIRPSIGGLAGGMLGRMARNRQKQQEESKPAATQAGSASSAGALMETTTELTSFAAGPVDATKFDVPAGFKQVEHEMKKLSR
jgi:hypothetical protein